MNKLSALRPSPALIVAFIALFVALSGTGYALKRASVGPKQLKTNAVTSSKIRKSAVTTSKIKADNVTGDKILESSLRKVPDADKLDGNDATVFERAGKTTRVASFSLGNNESKQIYTQGPLTLTAQCRLNAGPGPDDIARIVVSTTQNHSALDGYSSGDFDPLTSEVNRVLAQATQNTIGAPNLEAERSGVVVAPDGTQFVSQLWAGTNVLNQGNRCVFGGLIEQVS